MARSEILRPDSKGRITLGALAAGVSSYHVTINDDNSLLLEPYAEVPAREQWIFANKTILNKLHQGLEESAKGKLTDLGDFTQYIQSENDK